MCGEGVEVEKDAEADERAGDEDEGHEGKRVDPEKREDLQEQAEADEEACNADAGFDERRGHNRVT